MSSQYAWLSAAFFSSNSRASHEGICTPANPNPAAQCAIFSSVLNGAASPANCARKIPGPLMVFIICLSCLWFGAEKQPQILRLRSPRRPPLRMTRGKVQLELHPLAALVALNRALDKAHAAHPGDDAGQGRRQRVLAAGAPRLVCIRKLAIEHRKGLEVTLWMAARHARYGPRIGGQVGAPGMANFFAPVDVQHVQVVGILLRPRERCP